ncbi:hypothetical protein CO019_01465 [Candidatus Berkelbacteria bacterium CG_4_9_14_0_2_um_filter_42_30]|uniref:Uncharacterized protein n=2 Tax=Candidatus Berkelbacteria TaxID=1618330 RepID=A0A2M8G200_9BACT|nr:MAG: hypothetical protein CO019_01465 [Candidatus Berkelbacteria bacterium CG_4_9_14_0_2_um_filter_42_30]
MIRKLSSKIGISILFSQILFAARAYAHCPLCTVGAGAVAVGASYFGIKDAATGVFIGAFATALGFWSNRLIKKSYIKYQKELIIFSLFVLTIAPISQIVKSYIPFYINWAGDYGSVFHRTYIINSIIFGSLIGAIIMIFSPWINRVFKQKFRVSIPFQTMIIIFLLLIIAATIFQFTVE